MIIYQRSLTPNFHNSAFAQTAALAYDYPKRQSRLAKPTFNSCIADGVTQECFSALDGFAVGIGWACATVVWSADD